MPKTGISVRSRALTPEQDSITEQVLMPGESINYRITHEVQLPDGTKMWLAFGSETSVQGAETAQQAANRLVEFVHDQIELRIKEAVKHAQNITLD